ncbi:MAG: late competence development ComFB family protein [SAR324 cluster bacterium]|nr:late competence development ComFB family protein [SAR324 cluster bacterium]
MEREFIINGVSVGHIYNHNEERVAALIPEVLSEFKFRKLTDLDIEDIYALTLNSMPSRYMQFGSALTIKEEEVGDETVREQIRKAIERVIDNPR